MTDPTQRAARAGCYPARGARARARACISSKKFAFTSIGVYKDGHASGRIKPNQVTDSGSVLELAERLQNRAR
jgi:hypothetical protein